VTAIESRGTENDIDKLTEDNDDMDKASYYCTFHASVTAAATTHYTAEYVNIIRPTTVGAEYIIRMEYSVIFYSSVTVLLAHLWHPAKMRSTNVLNNKNNNTF